MARSDQTQLFKPTARVLSRHAQKLGRLGAFFANDSSDSLLIEGDSAAVLARIPDRIVQSCVTSPPYWSLRDYGIPGQIGLEPLVERYIAKLVTVFG